MRNRVFGVFFLFYIAVSASVLFVPALLIWATTRPFDTQVRLLNRYTRQWALLYLKSMPMWQLKTTGFEHIDYNQPYIIVSNHQSMLDILAGYALPITFKWMAKAELFRVPVMGWNMSLNGYIRIFRGKSKGTRTMMRMCENAISRNDSVFIFPEGTRSKDGKLKKFKSGAFAMAIKMGVPVLPVVIKGTAEALPKHSLRILGKQVISVSVLPPQQTLAADNETAAEFAHRIHDLIAAELTDNSAVATHSPP